MNPLGVPLPTDLQEKAQRVPSSPNQSKNAEGAGTGAEQWKSYIYLFTGQFGDLPVVYSLGERGSFSLARAIKVACFSDDNKIA